MSRRVRALRAVVFGPLHAALMVLTIPLWGLCVPLVFPFPYGVRYRLLTSWASFNLWALWVLCGLRPRFHGLERIPEQPCVVMAKHQSAWETIGLLGCFWPQTWVLKQELLRIPVFGWALRLLEPIAIDRGAGRVARQQVVEQGCDRLARKRWVIVFPEGTRTPPYRPGRYHIGGAQLAVAAGVPVVPVAHNAGSFWPRNSPRRYPGIIEVHIGPPIATQGKSAAAVTAEAEEWIEGVMERIQPPRQDGGPRSDVEIRH